MSETIRKNKHVTLIYTLNDAKGETIERINTPIQYIQGTKNQVIEKIETALEGKKEGDVVEVQLSPKEGFGTHQEALTFTDDIANVPPEFHAIGAEVEFQNDRGETQIFRVTKIEDHTLTVDGNHPFAGKNITYRIIVKDIRDATPDEMKNGIRNKTQLH